MTKHLANGAEDWPILLSIKTDDHGRWVSDAEGRFIAEANSEGIYHWLFRGRVFVTTKVFDRRWLKYAACLLIKAGRDTRKKA